MIREQMIISGRTCYLYHHSEAKCLLLQLVDEHDLELLDKEVDLIQELSIVPFSLAAFMVNDWNSELTPWTAPSVFGKIPFGDDAEATLRLIIYQILPMLKDKGVYASRCFLGGYSLAGLFALWSAYQTDMFDGIAAASPSVWFPQWIDYATEKKPCSKSIYLSLGDKEEKAKNPVMAQVGNAIRRQEEMLREQAVNTTLEWNIGNHFVDSEKRMAKGFAWLLNNPK